MTEPVEGFERALTDAAEARRVWLRWRWAPTLFGVAMCAEAANWINRKDERDG